MLLPGVPRGVSTTSVAVVELLRRAQRCAVLTCPAYGGTSGACYESRTSTFRTHPTTAGPNSAITAPLLPMHTTAPLRSPAIAYAHTFAIAYTHNLAIAYAHALTCLGAARVKDVPMILHTEMYMEEASDPKKRYFAPPQINSIPGSGFIPPVHEETASAKSRARKRFGARLVCTKPGIDVA
eukprot:191796-Rhodomonas_salina.3